MIGGDSGGVACFGTGRPILSRYFLVFSLWFQICFSRRNDPRAGCHTSRSHARIKKQTGEFLSLSVPFPLLHSHETKRSRRTKRRAIERDHGALSLWGKRGGIRRCIVVTLPFPFPQSNKRRADFLSLVPPPIENATTRLVSAVRPTIIALFHPCCFLTLLGCTTRCLSHE